MIADQSTLIAITGLQRPHAIRKWLDREKIPYLNGADNWPRVLQSIIVARLNGQADPRNAGAPSGLSHHLATPLNFSAVLNVPSPSSPSRT